MSRRPSADLTAGGCYAKNMHVDFYNAGKANAEIWRLEALLGLEKGSPIYQVKKFNARVSELRGLCDAKGINWRNAGAKPAAVAKQEVKTEVKTFACAKHPEFVTADPSEACVLCHPPAPPLSRQKLLAVIALFPEINAPAKCTDAELFELASAGAYRSFIRLPGMAADTEIGKRVQRDPNPDRINKVAQAFRRQRIERILAS